MNINKYIYYLERLTREKVILIEDEETFFVPQDLESRQEKYIQSIYRLLQQEVIDGDLELLDLPIKDLGKVKRVNGNVIIHKCYNLKDLGYLDYVKGYFDCAQNNLTTLKGAPKIVNGLFYCSRNKLTTLEGCPEIVNGIFGCSYNRLTTLEGCPKEVRGNFYCGGNIRKFTRKEIRAVCNVKGNISC